MKIFRAFLLIFTAALLVKILVSSVGGSFIAASSLSELSAKETELLVLYQSMIIYGVWTFLLSMMSAYFLYQTAFKVHQQSLTGLSIMIVITACAFSAQLLSYQFSYWSSALVSEFLEGTLWISVALVVSNVLLYFVAVLDKKNRSL